MMTMRIRILIIAILLVILGIIVQKVRKRTLELKYVLVWLSCDIVLLILTLFPSIVNGVARLMGVYSPVNALFFLGFIFSLMFIFSLTIAISKVTDEVRRITQVISMLPDDIQNEIHEKMQKQHKDRTDDGEKTGDAEIGKE